MSESKAQQSGAMPEVTFSTFILSLASSALVNLGEVPDPANGQKVENQTLARHSIDVLNMLHDKTKGNLDEQEKQMFESVLYELRMKYVVKYGS